MDKNLMPEVANLLGVEIGEEFFIENSDRKSTVAIYADGLHVVLSDAEVSSSNGKLLQKVLCGLYEVKKKPWGPKEGDLVFFPDPSIKCIDQYHWMGDTWDLALKVLGMVYRTREEAQEHFAEDYERLTGKKLE